MKDDYINKLRIHITQIEKMNAAMKYGVNKLLEEENLRQAQHPAALASHSQHNSGSSSNNRTTAVPDSGGEMRSFPLSSSPLC
jgi:hypothetical protein